MRWWLLVACLAAGCDEGAGRAGDAAPPAVDAARQPDAAGPTDAGPGPDAAPLDDAGSDAAAPPADGAPDATPSADAARPHPPRPPRTPAGALAAPRGWTFARGLIHMHSVHSHDACDGDPKPDGAPNRPCLLRLREALCALRMDYTLLTDHPATVLEVSLADSLLFEPGDEPVMGEDGPIANRMACPDGRRVLLASGAEGDLMPTLMQRRVDHRYYRDESAEAVQALSAAGGLVFQAHVERFEPEHIAPLGLHGIEIYNLHANLDPRGELRQLPEVLPDLTALIRAGTEGPHPDLSFVAIFRENHRALGVWDALTPTTRLVGIAGSDIHENLPPLVRPADGDRIDSYRRLGGWFANYLLVRDAGYDGIRDAVAAGRLFVTFDLLGEPGGFDFHGVTPGGEVVEMGSEAPFEPGTRLVASAPGAPEGATVELRLKRVTAEGVETVATTTGPTLEHVADRAAAWRLEVWITPEHLRAELGAFDRFVRPLIWVYANPVYLR